MKSLPAIQELIITSITAGGFSKALSDNGALLISSSEISQYFNRVFKGDADASGEVENLCDVYSGMSVTLGYSTQANRAVSDSAALGIIGKL